MTRESSVLLSVHDLSVRFGAVLAVDGVSFEVYRGEVFTLIGPNGAGKTTVFNLISRIYKPTTGHIDFAGTSLNTVPAHGIAKLGIARTFQNIELFEQATVLENLLIGFHAQRISGVWSDLVFALPARRNEDAARRKAEEVIAFLGLRRYRHQLISGLPYGIRKVVEIARALCSQPQLLLLDEPSSGLNTEETDAMAWWISYIQREMGITVLMVEHDMRLVSRVSNRVLVMNHGQVLTVGRPDEVQKNPAVIEAYLGSVEVSELRREAL